MSKYLLEEWKQSYEIPLFYLIFLFILFLLPLDANAKEKEEQDYLKFGFSPDLFIDVNINDAQVFTNMMMQKVIKRRETVIKAELTKRNINPLKSVTHIFDENHPVVDMIKSNEVDLVVLSPIAYYEIKDKNLLDPLYVSSYLNDLNAELLLIVNADSKIKNIADAKNKKFVYTTKFGSLIKLWVLSLIKDPEIKDIEHFFSIVKNADKPANVILPVFFEQADVCVVDKPSYELNLEMNPQLKNKLRILASSPGYPRAIISMRKSYPSDLLRSQMIDVLSNLHNESDGRQLLKIFNINKLVEFKKEYLRDLEKMMNELDDLYNKNKKTSRKK